MITGHIDVKVGIKAYPVAPLFGVLDAGGVIFLILLVFPQCCLNGCFQVLRFVVAVFGIAIPLEIETEIDVELSFDVPRAYLGSKLV